MRMADYASEPTLETTDNSILYHCCDETNGILWGASGNDLMKSVDKGDNWTIVHSFTDDGVAGGFAAVFVAKTGTILCFVRFTVEGSTVTKIMRSTDEINWSDVYTYDHNTSIFNAIDDHPSIGIVIGEYITHTETSNVKLIKSTDDGLTFSIVKEWDFCFDGVGDDIGDHIRHCHFVGYDPYEEIMWITTGDDNSQCRLYTYNGTDLTIIGSGTQAWRFCSLIFFEHYILMPTDNGNDHGKVYRFNRTTRKVDALEEKMDNLSLHSVKIDDKKALVFSEAWLQYNGDRDAAIAYVVTIDSVTEIVRYPGDSSSANYAGVIRLALEGNTVYANFKNVLPDTTSRFIRLKFPSIHSGKWQTPVFSA